MAEYQDQLNNMMQYQVHLAWSKWANMLDLKAGFHNIPLKSTYCYNLTFITHQGKSRWLKMPMGLM